MKTLVEISKWTTVVVVALSSTYLIMYMLATVTH
jgi:hypothetical protein